MQAAIHEEIERLKTQDVSDEELKMVKTRARATLVRGLASNSGLAQQLAAAQARYGDWREVFRQVDRIDKVSKQDIRRVANQTFVESNRDVGIMESTRPAAAARGERAMTRTMLSHPCPFHPSTPTPGAPRGTGGPRGEVDLHPAVALAFYGSGSTGWHRRKRRPPCKGGERHHGQREPSSFQLERHTLFRPCHGGRRAQPKRIVLPNGLVLFLQEDHELPLIAAHGIIRGGSHSEPAGKAGMLDIYGDVWRTGGTGKMTGDQMDDYLEARAAKLETDDNKESNLTGRRKWPKTGNPDASPPELTSSILPSRKKSRRASCGQAGRPGRVRASRPQRAFMLEARSLLEPLRAAHAFQVDDPTEAAEFRCTCARALHPRVHGDAGTNFSTSNARSTSSNRLRGCFVETCAK